MRADVLIYEVENAFAADIRAMPPETHCGDNAGAGWRLDQKYR
ncbi:MULTISPECIES: hypothetical protein [unclassified Thalassospira]|nr:hypothetical protein [Thalassospira sp. MCCC 1A01428]